MAIQTCPNGHSFDHKQCPVCPICLDAEMKAKYGAEFPKMGNPALNALNHAGITKFSDLTKYSEKELLQLHGFGPKGLRILKEALQEKGLSFAKK